MASPLTAFVLMTASLALAGCLAGDDISEIVRVENQSSAEGPATLVFRAPDGTIAHGRTLDLGGGPQEFTANLTSDIRYTAELVIGERVLISDPFHTGTDQWWVDITILDDAVRVSTLHGD